MRTGWEEEALQKEQFWYETGCSFFYEGKRLKSCGNKAMMERKTGLIRIPEEREELLMRMISGILALILALTMAAAPCAAETAVADVPVVLLRVAEYGDIYVELYPDIAPVTVSNFLKLVDNGFYNGLTFHRIISGFMAQGGCPLGNGTGGSGENIKGEFSANGVENALKHERGVLSMARSSDPDSASSQFFIMHADATHLDGNYAAFGRVIAGMDTVDAMCLNAYVTDSNGTVPKEDQPVITEAIRADRQEAEAAAALESKNGTPGGRFDDPATGLSFPMPEGWSLREKDYGTYLFTDGTAILSVSTVDVWARMGKNTREQYISKGLGREKLTTEAFDRSAFASAMGTEPEKMTEETVNGIHWFASSADKNGEKMQYRAGAVMGTVIILVASEGAAEQAMDIILTTLSVE